jgi:hypothetical protein
MTNPITTNTLITITSGEVTRINNIIAAYDAQAPALAKAQADLAKAQTDLATANTALAKAQADLATANAKITAQAATITSQAATIARLEAIIAGGGSTGPTGGTGSTGPTGTTGPTGSTGPTGPVTPPTGAKGLTIVGNKMVLKNGKTFLPRGIELMYAAGDAALNPAKLCKDLAALGANSLGVLFSPSVSSDNHLRTLLQAARDNGIVVGVNGDHMGNGGGPGGQAWLTSSNVVSICNSFDNVFIQHGTETGWDQTSAQWVADESAKVKSLRAAGHIHPIKVGSPDGGRSPKLPAAFGAQVLAADPLKNVVFTWQSYWKLNPTGWSYQSHNGYTPTANDPHCVQQVMNAINNSGLCFLIGTDYVDDIGTTIWKQVMTEADAKGIGAQHWVLFGDHYTQNNILGHWNMSPDSLTSFGKEVMDAYKIKSVKATF